MKFLKFLRFLLIPALLLLTLMLIACDECKHENIETFIVAPTHNDCGYTEYICPDCEYSYTEEFLDPIPHTYEKAVTEPTCDKEGHSLYSCECGHSYVTDIVAPLGHKYQKTITEPSCTKGGSTKYTCERCDQSYVSDITDALGHTFTDTVTAPTCTSQGYTTHKCDCGYSYKDKYTKPQDHTFSEVITPPSCTEQGYTTFSCECGYSYVDNYTSPIDHTFTQTVTAPTCTDEGFTTYLCDCGYKYIADYTKPTGHTLEKTTVDPTCTEQGYTTFTCDCGYSFKNEYTAPLSHAFEAEIISEATCTESGETIFSCSCGESYTLTVGPYGHDYLKQVTMPTLSDMGYTVYSCQNCDHTYTGDLSFYSDIVTGANVSSATVLAKGIDISYHNYKVDEEGNYISLDWDAIKNAGITYVIIRIGDTSVGIDPTFEKSYAEAKAAGLNVGFYLYTRAMTVNEITLEANFVLSALKGKQFEYPVYLDLEDDSQKEIDKSILNEMCVTFFTALQRSGYYTGLYVNHEWLYNVIDTETALSRFDIWYARHPSVEEGQDIIWTEESYGKPFGMWQYSDSGVIEGIEDTKFDFNYCYKDYPTIIKEYGFNGYESDAEFPDTDKSFVWVTYQGSIKIRSNSNFFTMESYDSDLDVIGYADYGSRFEIIEQNELYTAIKYNGDIAYISAKSEYVSFEGLYTP